MRTFSQMLLKMSFDAKKIICEITGLTRPINRHLIKYYNQRMSMMEILNLC